MNKQLHKSMQPCGLNMSCSVVVIFYDMCKHEIIFNPILLYWKQIRVECVGAGSWTFCDILRHFDTCRALLTRRTGDLNLGRFGELLPISTGDSVLHHGCWLGRDRISMWIGRFATRFAAFGNAQSIFQLVALQPRTLFKRLSRTGSLAYMASRKLCVTYKGWTQYLGLCFSESTPVLTCYSSSPKNQENQNTNYTRIIRSN